MEQTVPTVSLLVRESGDAVVIHDPENDDAWIRSDDAVRPRWRR